MKKIFNIIAAAALVLSISGCEKFLTELVDIHIVHDSIIQKRGDAKVLNGLDAVMQSKIDSIYTTLNARVTARIDTAYDNYMGFVEQYGYTINTADDINVQNYTALRQVFNNINSTHYIFLLNNVHFAVPEETVA